MAPRMITFALIALALFPSFSLAGRTLPIDAKTDAHLATERCGGAGEEECLRRRSTLDAHTDYIYTQHPSPADAHTDYIYTQNPSPDAHTDNIYTQSVDAHTDYIYTSPPPRKTGAEKGV